MESPAKLLHQIKRRVQSVTYGSPIYRMMLDQGPIPETLRLSIPDLWPGDSKQGQALVASQPSLFEQDALDTDFTRRQHLLTHECMRDLRALGSELARRRCVSLIHEWVETQDEWDEEGWSPGVLGARISNWIGFYDFYGSAFSTDYRKVFMQSLVRQLRHLLHTAQATLVGMDGLNAIKGLIYGGLCLTDSEKSLGLALDLLIRQLRLEILPDGGTVWRNPMMQATMLQALIDIRLALRTANIEVPLELSLSITKMVPALKFFRHGDGGLCLFNGSHEGSSLMLDAILMISEARGRALKHLPQTGYERVIAGRSLLMIDVAGPPAHPYDVSAHAGLMSFEFSVGKERILSNCGAPPDSSEQWRCAMAATAAHNTLVMGDVNACEVLPEGGIGHRPRDVVLQRYEIEGKQFVEVSHDAYMPRLKAGLQRILSLSEDGDILTGREVIAGPVGRDYTLRWHIHPGVNALLAQDGSSALLRTPSGAGWRLRVYGASGMALGLEASIYCGVMPARRTLQLRVHDRVRENPQFIEWTLAKEKTKKGAVS